MAFKGNSLSSLVVILLLLRDAVVATNISYQVLQAQTKNTIDIVDKLKISLKTQHSVNESAITQRMNKWSFGVSDCWNYSMTEDARLSDNYLRLKMLKNPSISISKNVAVEIGNLRRAIGRMRKKLGYPRVNTKGLPSHSLPTTVPQEQPILEVVFLSTVEKNLNLMLNDFHQRIPTKA